MNSRALKVRLRRSMRRAADLSPPTARGWFVGLLAAFCLWTYGFGSLDLVLFVVGVAGLVLLVLTGLSVALAAFYLRRRLERGAVEEATVDRLEAGSLLRTGFRAPALDRLPLVKIAWEWLEPGAVECRLRRLDRWRVEEVLAHRRCQVESICRRFTVYDVFGLARVSWQRRYPGPLLILPSSGRLRHVPVVQSLSAREGIPYPRGAPDGDRMEIRRYQPGDSVRHILWKTYARTRQLNVRLPERSVDRSQRTVAYLVAGADDEAAAAAARVALESGALGERWLFAADGAPEPTESLSEALVAIARSGTFPQRGATTEWGEFLEQVGRQGEGNCIVFVPGRAASWTPPVLELARARHGRVSFVVGIDGVVRNERRPLWRRLLFAEVSPQGVSRAALGDLLVQLAATGCPAIVVDRRSGKTFSAGQGRALSAVARPSRRRASGPRAGRPPAFGSRAEAGTLSP